VVADCLRIAVPTEIGCYSEFLCSGFDRVRVVAKGFDYLVEGQFGLHKVQINCTLVALQVESFVLLYFWMGRRVKEYLEKVKSWCDQERGRQNQLAEVAETTKQTVSNWFAGRQEPTAEQLLAVQEFLEKHRK